MGMDGDAAMLDRASPFDRECIDMMIPHHQGAIRMARAELANGQSPELKELAEAIVDAQANEIDEMNTWRIEWFGARSPGRRSAGRRASAGRGRSRRGARNVAPRALAVLDRLRNELGEVGHPVFAPAGIKA